eukprot:scaffold221840_cov31-Tisochrysis_lutea.AAC.3
MVAASRARPAARARARSHQVLAGRDSWDSSRAAREKQGLARVGALSPSSAWVAVKAVRARVAARARVNLWVASAAEAFHHSCSRGSPGRGPNGRAIPSCQAKAK